MQSFQKDSAATRERFRDAILVKKTGAPTRERLGDASLVKKTGAPTRERLGDATLVERIRGQVRVSPSVQLRGRCLRGRQAWRQSLSLGSAASGSAVAVVEPSAKTLGA